MKRFVFVAVLVLMCAGALCTAGEPIVVTGTEQEAKLVSRVNPAYPPEAKKAGIEGTVLLSVIIDEKGDVSKIEVKSGQKDLAQASVDAVTQWKYEPTLLNGKAVSVKAEVQVNFVLDKKK